MASSISPKGQTSLEVLIALAVLALMTAASFVLFGTTVQQEALSRERAQASTLVQQGMEASRQIRERDWNALATGMHGLALASGDWSFAGASDTTGIYHRTVTVTDVDANSRNLTVTVSWSSAAGGTAQESASSRLSNIHLVTIPSASNCISSSSVSGDWSHPVVVGSADIGPGNQGTDIAVSYPYIFMSGIAASSSKPDLFVFNASTPSAPSTIDTVDIGTDGINSLSLNGSSLYAASSNDSNELMVFNTATPASTSKIASVDLSGNTNGLTVLASSHWVALGRASNAGVEIYLYDVTNPAAPTYITGFEAGADVNDFATDGTRLYAVTSGTTNDLITIDMSDPAHPSLVGQYTLGDGYSDVSVAYHDPGKLFIGNANGKLLVVDVSNPASPTVQATYDAGGAVQDMLCVVNDLIYTGTANGTKEFQILNISDLSHISEYNSLNFPQVATGVGFANNMVFISMRSNDALRIITSSP